MSSILNAFTLRWAEAHPLNVSNPAITNVTHFSTGAGQYACAYATGGSIISAAGTGLVITGRNVDGRRPHRRHGRHPSPSMRSPTPITVNSIIADNGTGAVSINKVGLGILTIGTPGGGAWNSGNAVQPSTGSTYSGATTISVRERCRRAQTMRSVASPRSF